MSKLIRLHVDPPVGPCPSWCTLAPGHRWDSEGDDGSGLSRGHGYVVGDLDNLGVGVFGVAAVVWTSGPARELAGLLLQAAGEVDLITRA